MKRPTGGALACRLPVAMPCSPVSWSNTSRSTVGWGHVLWKTEQLVRRQDFRRLVVRIADELERVEVLNADDLRALMDLDREAAAA